jgi:hypothetical protein
MALFSAILSRFRARPAADPLLDEALARAADRVAPRVRHTRGWPRRYRQPIAAALAQARSIADAMPGPVTLDPERLTRDPLMHTLFPSADAMREALCSSAEIRQYVAGGERSGYMLLSLRRERKRVLGVEETDGMLRRDVPQEVVWFSDARVAALAPTLEQARNNLLWWLFDRFLERVAVGVARVRAQRDHLTREKELALARLRTASAADKPAARRALDDILGPLGEVTRCSEDENLAEIFAAVLSHPQDCLFLRSAGLCVDDMNIIRPGDEPGRGHCLNLVELHERYVEPRTVMLAYCADIRPLSQRLRLEQAQRLLV